MKGNFTMLRLKFAVIAAALLIGLTNVVSTFAGSSSVTDLRLAPGATVCLTPQSANISADAQGTANGAGANFVVYNGAVNATNPVYIALNSAGFHATFTTSFPMGATIPGKFKLCATNPSTTNNTRISMSLTTN
jgi:hypothetical protein